MKKEKMTIKLDEKFLILSPVPVIVKTLCKFKGSCNTSTVLISNLKL